MATVAHRAVVSSLFLVSLAGMTFLGASAVEVINRAREVKRLKKAAQESEKKM